MKMRLAKKVLASVLTEAGWRNTRRRGRRGAGVLRYSDHQVRAAFRRTRRAALVDPRLRYERGLSFLAVLEGLTSSAGA